MKIKNMVLDLMVTTDTLQRFYDVKLPIRYAFKLKRQRTKLQEVLKDFSESKKELIERFCDKDEDGNPISSGVGSYQFNQHPENLQLFNDEFVKFLGEETEVDFEKVEIPENMLGDSWSANDIEIIENLIKLGD